MASGDWAAQEVVNTELREQFAKGREVDRPPEPEIARLDVARPERVEPEAAEAGLCDPRPA